MAIPTSGITPATAWSPSPAWNSTITLIGDSENLIGENADGETATVNRAVKQVAANALYLYNLQYHYAIGEGIYMPGADSDFNSILDYYYKNKILRFKLTLTLEENLTLNNAYDEIFEFYNIVSFDEVEINLNSKIISVEAGFTNVGSSLFDFQNCIIPSLIIKDGTITDTTGNLFYGIQFNKCIGHYVVRSVNSTYLASTSHIYFNASKGAVETCNFTVGEHGIIAGNGGFVLSQDNSSTGDVTGYGLRAILGGTIRKYDATQPTGTSGNESESTGGLID